MPALKHQAELRRVSRKVKGIYDAIADCLRTPHSKISCSNSRGVRPNWRSWFHGHPCRPPACIQSCGARRQPTRCAQGSRSPLAGSRDLGERIERITVRGNGAGHDVELTGISWRFSPFPGCTFGKVVAGARSHLYRTQLRLPVSPGERARGCCGYGHAGKPSNSRSAF